MASAPSYFVDHKKGEVNELRALLSNPDVQRDPQRKRDVLKRVVAYQTLGIDVSRLFPEMILSTNTSDILQKKMIYDFIVHYAEQRSELAIMTVNTLVKEACDNIDPMVRGLALKHLASLRLANIIEYVLQPVQSRLEDQSPYVRKTAVMAVVKVHNVDPKTAKPMIASLEKMMRDKDPQVVANCIVALEEIYADQGGLELNKSIIYHLLNRIREFSEWSQCVVLDLVARYSPENEKDVFDIMSLLDERLKSTNAGVVLATTKIFLNFTVNMPKIHKQAYQRIKDPLLTLMTGGGPEMAFTVLSHIRCLAERCSSVFTGDEAGVFDEEYKKFFCRYNDPLYVKSLKLDILKLICTDASVKNIVEELREYVTDVDVDVARKAIQTIGHVAWRLPTSASRVIEELLKLLELDIDYVSAETVIAMKDLLRKYPERVVDVLHVISASLATLDEADARVAALWMLGEYGEQIDESPYVLEPIIDAWGDETSAAVHLEILTTTVKLFFKRPGEVHKMLGRLLVAATADTNNNDVHDRALFYFRLLEHDVNEAKEIIMGEKDRIVTFVEETETEIKDRIFEEFNTLSVVYNQPSEKFLPKVVPAEGTEDDDDDDDDEDDDDDDDASEEASASEDDEGEDNQASEDEVSEDEASEDSDEDSDDSDDSDDDFALSSSLSLGKGAFQVFESTWGSSTDSESVTLKMRGSATEAALESGLKAHNVHMMATGKQGNQIKAYYIAEREGASGIFLAEIIVDVPSRKLQATLKTDNVSELATFAKYMKNALSGV